VLPLIGPLGVAGGETVSDKETVTERAGDQLDTTVVSIEHRA
jgi:hypothetical protein